jgi:hypothetical protein
MRRLQGSKAEPSAGPLLASFGAHGRVFALPHGSSNFPDFPASLSDVFIAGKRGQRVVLRLLSCLYVGGQLRYDL